MKYLLFAMFCALAAGCNQSTPSAPADRSTTKPPSATQGPAAANEPSDRTNTGVNVRDRDSTAQTPMDQNENKADVTITADIRKRVVDTKMSINAQNVKIITKDGKVTLRGPVADDQEKQKIEEIAKDVAGANSVDNQLEVSTK